jgi:hypothetical protein
MLRELTVIPSLLIYERSQVLKHHHILGNKSALSYMNAFKNLNLMGTQKGRLVSDNSDNDEIFCYMHHIEREPYNLQVVSSPQRRKPTVVTSTRFDNDDAFADVAMAMLYRYEHERLTERETITATLTKPEEVRAFLEALDLKYAAANAIESGTEDSAAWDMNEIVHQIRAIFFPSLQSIWKESVSLESAGVASNMFAGVSSEEPATLQDVDDEYYRKPPRTPKNLSLSPVACAYASNDGISMTDGGGFIQTPSKRRRCWFFSENGSDRFVQRSVASSINPFVPGKKFPELRFEFGGTQSLTSKFAPKRYGPIVYYGLGMGMASKGDQPVELLQREGFGPMGGTFGPPTSPIRKVSIELDHPR